jgi:hypothetical protein
MVKGGGRERREKERETRRDREKEGRREQAMDGERDGASDGVKEGGREGGREEGRDGGVSRRVTCRRVGGGASEEWMERWKVGWKKTEDWKCEVEGMNRIFEKLVLFAADVTAGLLLFPAWYAATNPYT